MSANDFRRIFRLFEAALARPASDRRAWLARECAGEPELHSEVAGMLAAHERAGGILDRSLEDVVSGPLDPRDEGAEVEASVGPYRLEREIGRGGMGVVYLAYDPRLDRHVAIKFLPSGLQASREAKARFLVEARAASTLDHPNICTIHDIGESGAGRLYIVMAYYEGRSLAERIGAGPLPLDEALDITAAVAAGLGRAHEAGIVHRDVKPANIMLTDAGVVKILDFGVAKLEGGATLTDPGFLLGTPAYMSPEQLWGEEIDHRTDLWSLGVVLFEMLAGKRPFRGDRGELFQAIVKGEPPDLSDARGDLPVGVDTVLRRLLSKSPGERYPTAPRLIADIDALRSSRALTSDLSAPAPKVRGNLPTSLTSFVGREAELEYARELLSRTRLLTLTGAGGTGKTRLALQLAWNVAAGYRDGVFFVRLGTITDPDLVAPTIAQTLGYADTASGPVLAVLQTALRDQELLLVLDNFEQVAEAASLLTQLLESCLDLKIIVTSRAPLRVTGEQELPVPPLSVPERDEEPSARALKSYSAVGLFVDRANAASPGFELTDGNAPAVSELCRRLDGLPLAIELAAARIKLLSPEAMLARLSERLDLPGGGARDRPERHQTLRQTVGWSYELLDPPVQRLFRQISVFVGGCTLGAIEAVCGAVAADIDVIEGVAALVDHSLLRRVGVSGDEPRFSLLGTIRRFGLEELERAGESEAASRAHAEYYLAFAERAAPELTGREPAEWLDRLDAEHDNLRAVLAWAESTGAEEVGLRLAGALWRFWLVRGHLVEGRRRLEALLADNGSASAAVRAAALNGLGTLTHNHGDNVVAREYLEESLELFRKAAERRGTAAVLNNLSWVAAELCDFDRARELAEEALGLCRELGETRGIALAVNNLGWVACYRGECREACRHFEESLALRRAVEDRRGVAFAQCNLAWARQYLGEYDEACELIDEAMAILRPVDDRTLLGWALNARSLIALSRGDLDRAEDLVNELIEMWQEGWNRSVFAWALNVLGQTHLDRGELDAAERVLSEARSHWQAIESSWGLAETTQALGSLAAARGDNADARELYRESLRRHRRHRNKRGMAESLEAIADIAAAEGDASTATHLLASADVIRGEIEVPVPPRRREAHGRLLDRLRNDLGRAFDSTWSTGASMDREQALELAAASRGQRPGPPNGQAGASAGDLTD
ncbi:MAG: tetratricopeptide repeat protein [Gemmatimonadetes bacterium]|uniref:Tetratricopeptide repeat protein n=1 Tax=Candidatus Kutchimonas denitrificans TaxID=3056748 RepID=A0AAE4ZCY4_9BACT|nr:tetratricopeptide repeat protein [Gemmatimonadota bacterium]NIR76376.1 tetratricopeptide repeat protein [Candidatus Kutchimonas denitrificans]NIS03186.1 tetratricopeptide repeat protein [Gemmatimonadota bacterium]NIT66359.1 tetratricopeptide repeat protein [Gemmatimonadota bacterium]NIU54438.1 tetratricopeptide repeat protein [Gemmatimonadota bacterium]